MHEPILPVAQSAINVLKSKIIDSLDFEIPMFFYQLWTRVAAFWSAWAFAGIIVPVENAADALARPPLL